MVGPETTHWKHKALKPQIPAERKVQEEGEEDAQLWGKADTKFVT